MAEYYLDIETNSPGVKPSPDDEIITIQYQRLNRKTGHPEEDLVILKSWESSERGILTTFYRVFQPEKSFTFVPIGMNLNFDFFLLHNRWKTFDIKVPLENLFYTLPYMDIKPIIVLLNEGEFKGARLDRFTGKEQPGAKIPELYAKRDFNTIEQYIRNEAKEFIEFYQKLKEKIPYALR